MAFVNGIDTHKLQGDGSTSQYVTEANSPVEIARGDVLGASPFGAYGEITTSGLVTKNVIWPDGTFYVPNQTTGEAITFVSTSAQDAGGGR